MAMEIKVLEKTKKRLTFELKGSDHTFCNALKKELYEDDSVKLASYTIEHPLIGIPKFLVETSGDKEPEKALTAAAKRLQKKNEQVQDLFKKFRS